MFTPVAKPATICLVLSIVVFKAWEIRQLDVSKAFSNGNLDDIVFMEQPLGFTILTNQILYVVCIALFMVFAKLHSSGINNSCTFFTLLILSNPKLILFCYTLIKMEFLCYVWYMWMIFFLRVTIPIFWSPLLIIYNNILKSRIWTIIF